MFNLSQKYRTHTINTLQYVPPATLLLFFFFFFNIMCDLHSLVAPLTLWLLSQQCSVLLDWNHNPFFQNFLGGMLEYSCIEEISATLTELPSSYFNTVGPDMEKSNRMHIALFSIFYPNHHSRLVPGVTGIIYTVFLNICFSAF